MAPTSSPTSKPSKEQASATKRLSDLLKEKQEPFVLEVYLLERRYHHPPKKSSSSSVSDDSTFGCFSKEKSCPRSSCSKSERRSRPSVVPVSCKCTRVAKAILNKVVSVNETVEVKNEIEDGKMQASVNKEPKFEREMEEVELEGTPPPTTSDNSCSTELQTRSRSDEIEDVEVTSSSSTLQQSNHLLQASKEQGLRWWRTAEENKDCSPVSVLDPIEPVPRSDDDSGNIHFMSNQRKQETMTTISSPTSSMTFPKKDAEEGLFSASQWELLTRSQRENNSSSSNSSCAHGPSKPYYSQYIINSKKAVQQSRQLMFDCVREAVEVRAKKQKIADDDGGEEKGLMRPEEIGKFICQKILTSPAWGEKSGKKLTTQLIRSELVEEWPWLYNGVGKEIGKEVGDWILEEIIDELFEEVVGLSQ